MNHATPSATTGTPPLHASLEIVILPGLDGTGTLLRPFVDGLASHGLRARVIAYPFDRPLDYTGLAPHVRAQLPAGPFVLLGESFSGPLAIRIAADAPSGLRGLVLSTTFARAPVPVLRPLAGLTGLAPARPPIPLLSWALLGRWARPDLQALLRDALVSVAPAVLRTRAAAALRVDVSAHLSRVQVPALNLIATHDRLLARAAGRRLARGLRDCRTIHVEGPHLLLQSAPAICAESVAAFALGLGGRATIAS